MESRVINLFHQSIEAKMSCGELLAPQIEAASTVVVSQLLQDKKLLSCGNAESACLSSVLAKNLALYYQMERPGFAAFALNTETAFATANLQQHGTSSLFAEQVKVLGSEGDVLLVFSDGQDPGNLVRAIQVAHDKDMLVIGFTADNDTNIKASLSDKDCLISVPLIDRHRITEVHLLCIYSICDLIDFQLFGGTP